MQEVSKQRMWIVIIGASLVSLAVLTVILIINIRNKQRVNRVLKESRDRINQQNEKLETINKFKDRLLSVVSHDVRGPLNSIKGIFELFNRQLYSPQETTDMLVRVGEKVTRVSVFVDDLLLWAKNQMTHTEVKKSIFELNEAIDKTIALLKPEADKKQIQLHVALETVQVEADQEMIKIVVRNLMSNAIKFCYANDTIEIISKTQGNHVMVSVRDSGTGIPPEKLIQMFNGPHDSVQGTNYEVGTGLGLILSKQYIELNGGTIGVEPNGNRGTKFWFMLPLIN